MLRNFFYHCKNKSFNKSSNYFYVSGGFQELKKLNMSIFTQCLNPITGRMEWVFHKEDYDFKQEIARSSYADMLHDHERNIKYYDGLKSNVKNLRRKGQEIHVLDIGTGTGLLSMMAIECGVDSVTACEAFGPVAECAASLIRKNGYEDKIKIIGKRSTELTIGPNEDQLARRANLLVTEVFDTELIGEGALETFLHAKEHLLTPDALIVPSKGTIYAQVVNSEWLRRWNKIPSVSYEKVEDSESELISTPQSISNCPGSASVWDIQLSQVRRDLFSELSNPIDVFRFDWSGREIPLTKNNCTSKEFSAKGNGSCDAIFMWWDLTMDAEGEILLSCAPFWEHPDSSPSAQDSTAIPWRDHWMQAVYFPPKSIEAIKGELLSLVSAHDEYSLWFNVVDKKNCVDISSLDRHDCLCGFHGLVSRSRLAHLCDPKRISLYKNILMRHVTSNTIGLVLGDVCIWAVAMAKLGARHVYIKENNSMTRRILEQYIKSNGVDKMVTFLPDDVDKLTSNNFIGKIDLIFSEPFFSSSLLPWHSILQSYILNSMKEFISMDAIFLPSKMRIKALPVHYRDLWKIRAPLNECCGFKMSNFDQMIENASIEADSNVEPQPLWEYPTSALSISAHTLFEISLNADIPQPLQIVQSIPLNQTKFDMDHIIANVADLSDEKKILNGMSLWCDWEFGPEEVYSTGAQKAINLYDEVEWDPYTRQGIYLFNEVRQDRIEATNINVDSSFDPIDGSFKFDFKLKKNLFPTK